MPRPIQQIAVTDLYSPKERVEPRKNEDLTQMYVNLVKAYASNAAVDPIEVVPIRQGYYILNGGTRALAARAAGRTTIAADVIPEAVAGKDRAVTRPSRYSDRHPC